MRYRRIFSCAALALGLVSVAHAEGSTTSSTRGTAPELTRAQVLEDLQQWHAAGMSFVPHPSGYSDSALRPEYQRYLQMRQSKTEKSETLAATTEQPQR